MPTIPIGHAERITVEGMEDGFELKIETEKGTYIVNVHGVTHDLEEIGLAMGEYWAEGRQAAREHQHDLEQRDAYDLRTDPKHPDWHSVHADRYDSMRGDR